MLCHLDMNAATTAYGKTALNAASGKSSIMVDWMAWDQTVVNNHTMAVRILIGTNEVATTMSFSW
jgi:hypothetical protein